ncbi:MAG TPA: response regulator transcription factor [Conexibacter sp.]|nr:response regulator transcription factor [Conexibacter sp.]
MDRITRPQVCLAVAEPELHERVRDLLTAAGHDVRSTGLPLAAIDLRPDAVVVLAEGGDPSHSLRALADAGRGAAIVALLDDDAAGPAVRRALRAGASGVVLAMDLDRALAPTVAAVAGGQAVVPRAAERQLVRPALSVRERQVLSLVVMGLMNGEIAAQLFVAESTVKSHLSSAFAKLGVRSRTEAIELILDPDEDMGLGILRIGGEPLMAVAEAS